MTMQPWWDGKARKRLPPEVKSAIENLLAQQDQDPRITSFDRHSRLKVASLYLTAFACFAGYFWLPSSWLSSLALVLILGLFAIPYTRIFMHSQMHWGMGGNRLERFLLNHFISLLFAVPQTGYVYGHRAHHRYDNDFNPNGLPKDLQSTYLFSRNGQPTPVWLWLLFYIFVYQIFVHAYLVLRHGKTIDKWCYGLELGVILGFQAGLFAFDSGLYTQVYLPGLLLAWIASGIVLYMMHAVDSRQYDIHPTNDSLSPFFNRFGDNDGYHLEHSLFPSLHPIYLADIHPYFKLPENQCTPRHYVLELFARSLRPKRLQAKPQPLLESQE